MARKSPRLYVPDSFEGGVLNLDAAQVHYLKNVMRKKEGEEVRVFNGRDGEWRGQIITLRKKEGEVELVEQTRFQEESKTPPVSLCFAPIKPTRLQFLIEKATELGASGFYPVITEYTDVRTVKVERLEAQSLEASEQSERLSVPTLHASLKLPLFLKEWPLENPLYVGDERGGGRPLREALEKRKASRATTPAGFFVGPEGGFSEAEFRLLSDYSFVEFVSLGPQTLRSETAALAAFALFHSFEL